VTTGPEVLPPVNIPNIADQRTSLARLASLWQAKIVVVSCPEMGAHNPQKLDTDGKEVFDARVMSILEHLPEHLKTDVEVHVPVEYKSDFDRTDLGTCVTIKGKQWRKDVYHPEFTLAVDFAGSASKKLCDSRTRWMNAEGHRLFGDKDFDRTYSLESMEQELKGGNPMLGCLLASFGSR